MWMSGRFLPFTVGWGVRGEWPDRPGAAPVKSKVPEIRNQDADCVKVTNLHRGMS